MAEEVGIVMTLYDRVSPTLKSIAGSNKAFDKSLDELEASLKAYDAAYQDLYKQARNAASAISKVDNRAGAGGGADGSGASMLAALGKAGLGQMAGDAAQEAANTELQRTLDSGDEAAYMERIARDKLGYVLPGEHIYVDMSGD